ncbi:MAG: BLUF domain-containing protein [Verrucomicrobiaceae bacterium]|nr:MAG: BLUF domain-containing protein [Verrucomicrobiaceae bacterium]
MDSHSHSHSHESWQSESGFYSLFPHMIHIIYMSSQTGEFSKAQLRALLEASFENNTRLGVTGILLYRNGNFLQLIEGEAAAVDSLLQKISQDPRHKNIMVFLREEIPGRQFGGWSMAFRDLSMDTACSEGFNGLLNQDKTDISQLPSKARAFMRMFTV